MSGGSTQNAAGAHRNRYTIHFDLLSGMGQIHKPVLVYTFISEFAIKIIEIAVLGRLTCLAQFTLDTMMVDLQIPCFADQLWTLIRSRGSRVSTENGNNI